MISGQNVPEDLTYQEDFVAKLSSNVDFETFELEEDCYPPIFDIAVEEAEKGNLLRSIGNKTVRRLAISFFYTMFSSQQHKESNVFCKRSSLNPLRFSLIGETDKTKKAEQFCQIRV